MWFVRPLDYSGSQKIGIWPSSNPKSKKKGRAAYIMLHAFSNLLESTELCTSLIQKLPVFRYPCERPQVAHVVSMAYFKFPGTIFGS